MQVLVVSFFLIVASIFSYAGFEDFESFLGEPFYSVLKKDVEKIILSYSGGLKFKKGYFDFYISHSDKHKDEDKACVKTKKSGERKRGRPRTRCLTCTKKFQEEWTLKKHEETCKEKKVNKSKPDHSYCKKQKPPMDVNIGGFSKIKKGENLIKSFNQIRDSSLKFCESEAKLRKIFQVLVQKSPACDQRRYSNFCFSCHKMFGNSDQYRSHVPDCGIK